MTDPVDKKVKIEFVLDPEATSIPKEFSMYPGSFLFYFPACQVYRELDKDIRIVPMPKDSRVIDLMRRTDQIKIVGTWFDDTDGLYDGLTAFERLMNIRFIEKYLPMVGKFTWINAGGTVSETLMSRALNADVEPGDENLFTINFELLILDRTVD